CPRRRDRREPGATGEGVVHVVGGAVQVVGVTEPVDGDDTPAGSEGAVEPFKRGLEVAGGEVVEDLAGGDEGLGVRPRREALRGGGHRGGGGVEREQAAAARRKRGGQDAEAGAEVADRLEGPVPAGGKR